MKAYAALFEKLLSIEPRWQPETKIIDFELAAMAGIQFIFPGYIQGCWYLAPQQSGYLEENWEFW